MSHSALCRIQGYVVRHYVVRHYVAFGVMSFGIMSLGIMSFGILSFGIMTHSGLWHIRDYVTFSIMSHSALCRIRPYVVQLCVIWHIVIWCNVVRRNVVWRNVVRPTVGVSAHCNNCMHNQIAQLACGAEKFLIFRAESFSHNQRIYISDSRVSPPLRCQEEALTQPLSPLSAVSYNTCPSV